MRKKPVYNLRNFSKKGEDDLCYVSRLSDHLKTHKFVNSAHRHDFFLILFFTAGRGKHWIDFAEYQVKPNCIFVMQPGQLHHWKLSSSAQGYVCFHSREFYEAFNSKHLLSALPFYRSTNQIPYLTFSAVESKSVLRHFEELLEEYKNERLLKEEKLAAYLDSIYIDIARLYGETEIKEHNRYLHHLRHFQDLLEKQFTENRSPKSFAKQMHLTVKHLNRITTSSLGKTVSGLIADRVVLEAKRKLGEDDISVSEVAYSLNFTDVSYFSRFFKKHTGVSPHHFAKKEK